MHVVCLKRLVYIKIGVGIIIKTRCYFYIVRPKQNGIEVPVSMFTQFLPVFSLLVAGYVSGF